MSISKFNELGNSAINRVPRRQDSAAGGTAAPGGNSTNAASSAARSGGHPASLMGAGVDWFSQLESGTAHPMKASNRFGTNPSIDTVVDSILSDLGLHHGSE